MFVLDVLFSTNTIRYKCIYSINRQLGRTRPKFNINNKQTTTTTSQGKVDTNTGTTMNLTPLQQQTLQEEQGRLTKELAQLVRSFGVSFKEGAGDDCAAAVAILLFGHTDTILPGGYAGEEISLDSPIVQVQEFPAELVLLGRATVMVKGIANRLQISWGLSDRWKPLAQEALASVEQGPGQYLPVWSVSQPIISSPLPILGRSSASANKNNNSYNSDGTNQGVSNSNRLRFRDIGAGFRAWLSLVKEYAVKKLFILAQRYLPKSVQKKLFNYIARLNGY